MRKVTNNMKYLLSIAVLLLWNQVQGQNDSRLGRFSSDFVTGCAPLSINITVNDNFGNIVRQYIYEEGGAETNDTFHTFTRPGTYDIVQIVQSQSPRTDTLTVVVTEAIDPTFEIFSCPGNAARVLPTSDHYDFYRIYFNSDTDSVETLPNQLSGVIQFSSGTVQSLRIQGFMQDGPGNCGEVTFNYVPISNFQNPEITNLSVQQHCQDLIAIDLQVSMTNAVRHQLQYTQNGTDFVTLDTLISQNSYTRSSIPVSSNQVCFRLVALDECTGADITSAIVCDNSLQTIVPSISDISASFATNGIDFSWNALPIVPLSHEVSKAPAGGSFSTLLTTETNAFTDGTVTNGNSMFDYQLVSSDTCGNSSSPSILVRPVFLRAIETSTNNFDFSWNNYLGWNTADNLIEYTLQTLSDGGQVIAEEVVTVNDFSRNIAADPGTNYRIQAFDLANSRSVFSNTVTLVQQPEIIVPSAFTPNADGLNETFAPILEEASSFQMKIFSRWGELIFVSNSIFEGWDGNYKRGLAPAGTYIYQISLTDENGRTIEQRGAFILIR